ncbi:hypothetical protein LPJ71_010344, partial [Coemansia sp. S17]
MWRQLPLSQAPILPLQLATQSPSGVLHSETTDALYWPRLSTHQSGSPSESEALTSLHSSSKPAHDEKLKRLRHRLYEVLEDNSRLAALLSDAESLIEQLRKENASLVGHMNRALDSAGSYCGGGLESSMRSLSSSANSLHIGSVRHANVVDSLIVSRSMSTASSARSNQDTSALVYVSDVAAIHFAPTTPSSSSDQAASVIPRKSDIYNVTEFGQHHPARPKYSSDTFGEERPLSIGHSSTNTKHAAPSGVGSPI